MHDAEAPSPGGRTRCLARLNRKTLVRHVSEKLARRPRRKHRAKTCGHDANEAMPVSSHTSDYFCAARLTRHLVATARELAVRGELELSPALMVKLGHIGVSTMRQCRALRLLSSRLMVG